MAATATAAPPNEPASGHERVALWVFVAYLVIAGPLVLFWLGRYHWFFGDEWSFLAERDGADLHDLFRSHGEHWVTLPVISYRLLYNAFGLRSYLPYQAVLVCSHLVCAGLLRVVMRRADVRPWTATIVASVFVLLGPGEENIVWAFQIAFVFALLFGLMHLILSDHDGPVDRRDWLALAAGTAGLMSSGLSLVMVVVVGMAVFIRRGPKMAAWHTLPLVALYATWYTLADPGGIANPYGRSGTPAELLRFVWSGVPAGLEAVGGHLVIGLALGAILVVGLALVVRTDPQWRRVGPSAALFIGAFLFLAGTAYTRWFVTPTADSQSRYLYTLVAFSLPLFGVATDMIIRRRSTLAPLVLLPFVLAIVVNLDGFGDRDPWNAPYHRREKQTILLMAHSDLAREVPAEVRPNPWFTVGWLRTQVDEGAVPDPPAGAEARASSLPILLAAVQINDVPAGTCDPVEPGTQLLTRAGERVGFAFADRPDDETPFFLQNTIVLTSVDQSGGPMGSIAFPEAFGATLQFAVDGLVLEPRAAAPGQGLLLCR